MSTTDTKQSLKKPEKIKHHQHPVLPDESTPKNVHSHNIDCRLCT